MPVYNSADTLEESLRSLQSQTLEDYQLIIVDDGSTDASPQVLRQWADDDPRIEIITSPHQGIIQALNMGIDACQSPYIARMDADDRCHPRRLELQLELFESDPSLDVVSCLVQGFPADQVREGYRIYMEWLNQLVTDHDIKREIFIESPLPHPSVMMRADRLKQAGGYQEHGWPEDYELWLRLYGNGARFAKVPKILLDWREHPDRLTRVDPRYSVENFLRAKAYYMGKTILADRDAVIIWGAGMMGRRLGKQLQRVGASIAAFIDIDPKKIGRTLRRRPIIAVDDLMNWWGKYSNPVILSAVASRGARPLIRKQLVDFGFIEGQDWWCAA